jgi:8-oxo-dGTP pyrophosphatase MutT (NUDIX family)
MSRLVPLTVYQKLLEKLGIPWDRFRLGKVENFAQLMLVQPSGFKFPWLVFDTSNAVAILIANTATDQVLLVKQRRPAMINDANQTGEIVEVVAGRADQQGLSLIDLIIKEVKEETTLDISPEEIQVINEKVATTPGCNTERITLSAVILNNPACKFPVVNAGNKEEDEDVQTIIMTIKEFLSFSFSDLKTMTLQLWFDKYIGIKN